MKYDPNTTTLEDARRWAATGQLEISPENLISLLADVDADWEQHETDVEERAYYSGHEQGYENGRRFGAAEGYEDGYDEGYNDAEADYV